MEMKKTVVLGLLSALSVKAFAHPGHGDSLLEEVFHTLTAADHLPLIIAAGMVIVTGLLVWRSRR
ncbi:HupE/UreJ family protein [Zwartia vadi]|uniref:HupE/UreJ family protein n=1 Tax=Zwartia vadi TaxID=3058168 RepID=UPI0025B2A8B8|nr:HupE/UreJ family protein [Zwartia vadi]MDN3987491.1 HupE/UreJ family protein [Zwartia vadi]